jgi:hypothetical protein
VARFTFAGDTATYVMVVVWGLLSIAAMVVQYRFGTSRKKTKVDEQLAEEEKLIKGRETLRRK